MLLSTIGTLSYLANPYYQYFCGELSFCHRLPFDRSSMTRWRQRLREEQLVALIQESLSVAHQTGAIGPKDLERVAVDTKVQPKAVAHPTDAADASGHHQAPSAMCAAAPELSAPFLDQRPRSGSGPHHLPCMPGVALWLDVGPTLLLQFHHAHNA